MSRSLFVGGSLSALGLLVLLGYERARRRCRTASRWPAVTGRVIEAHVRPARHGFDEVHAVFFAYEYEYDTRQRTGRGIDLFEFGSRATLEEMEDLVRQYPRGSQVTVYVDPHRPSISVIERGPRLGHLRSASRGALLALAGLLVMAAGPYLS